MLILAAAAIPFPTFAQSKYVGGAGAGNWSLPANWNPAALPGAGSSVNFIHSDALTRTLNYDYTGPATLLGVLSIDQTNAGSFNNTFSMQGNALTTNETDVAIDGRGAFSQTGGTHTTETLILGSSPGSAGTYTLSGSATLKTNGQVYLGYAGSGSINQSGGTHTAGDIALGLFAGGSGTYTLSAGNLTVIGTENISYDMETISAFTQSGGTHSVGENLILADGFDPTDGVIKAGATYQLNAGSLNVIGATHVGYQLGNATFTQSGGTHTAGVLYLASNPTASGTYNLDGGQLQAGTLAIGGSNTAGGLGQLKITTGNLNVTSSLRVFNTSSGSSRSGIVMSGGTLTSPATVIDGVYTQTGGVTALGAMSGSGPVTIGGGAGTAITSVQSLNLSSLTITNNAAVAIVQSVIASSNSITSLAITGNGTLDLASNSLLVSHSSTPLSTVRQLLKNGYASGAWNGTGGIISSNAAASTGLGLGYADNQGAAADLILIKFALLGDSDLDGTVGFSDLVALAQNYDTLSGAASWSMGDFNYDGNVDFSDLVMVAQNYDQTLAAPVPSASLKFSTDFSLAVSNVPEPGSLMLLAFVSLCSSQRRRRPNH